MSIMNKLTASYVAGLIDGEGCLEIQKRKSKRHQNGVRYVPRIRIAMTDKNIIQWLKDSFGGWITPRKGKGDWSDSWAWCLNYKIERVKEFLLKIMPYMKVKKEEAEVLRKFLNTFNDSVYEIVDNPTGGKHRELKDGTLSYREELHQKIRALKH